MLESYMYSSIHLCTSFSQSHKTHVWMWSSKSHECEKWWWNKTGEEENGRKWRCVDYVSWPFLMKSTWNNICLKPQNICKRTGFFRACFVANFMSAVSYCWECFASVRSMMWFANHANRDYLSTAVSMQFWDRDKNFSGGKTVRTHL